MIAFEIRYESMPSVVVVIAAATVLAYQILNKVAVAVGPVESAIEAADTWIFDFGKRSL